jgi:hypothetical protein
MKADSAYIASLQCDHTSSHPYSELDTGGFDNVKSLLESSYSQSWLFPSPPASIRLTQ